MRLDANLGHRGWTTYHAERCKVLKGVVWVDDEARQWCEHVLPLAHVDGRLLTQVHQAKRIMILAERKLVVINPVGVGDRWTCRGDVIVGDERAKVPVLVR